MELFVEVMSLQQKQGEHRYMGERMKQEVAYRRTAHVRNGVLLLFDRNLKSQ